MTITCFGPFYWIKNGISYTIKFCTLISCQLQIYSAFYGKTERYFFHPSFRRFLSSNILWIPAFAGMTRTCSFASFPQKRESIGVRNLSNYYLLASFFLCSHKVKIKQVKIIIDLYQINTLMSKKSRGLEFLNSKLVLLC